MWKCFLSPCPISISRTFCFFPHLLGKTALAREISRALRARTPKIVSAPELLDRWVRVVVCVRSRHVF
jgi:hypothetical protein